MRVQTLTLTLTLLVMAAALASCTASDGDEATVGSLPTAESTASEKSDNAACTLLTADVIELAAFPVQVSLIEGQSPIIAGLSVCIFGDEPNPDFLSLNAIELIKVSPYFLQTHHSSAQEDATEDRSSCVAGTSRQLGPQAGLGTFAFFCVGKPGAVRGAWIQNGDVYHLSYHSVRDGERAVANRLDRFEAVARAISAKVPR